MPPHTAGPKALPVGRRRFLGTLGGATTAAIATGRLHLDSSMVPEAAAAFQDEAPPGARTAAAALPLPAQRSNGDESDIPNFAASFTKALPHDQLGHVDSSAYGQLLDALASGETRDFERLTLGPPGHPPLANPRAGLSFDDGGLDPRRFTQPPAPAFASAEAAGEMVELSWMALLRDVSFLNYGVHPLAAAAALELDRLSHFNGPTEGGHVTPRTLFRDDLPGCLVGPYVSQFLWLDTPLGTEEGERRMKTLLPHTDHATRFDEWLAVQEGLVPGTDRFDPVRRYVRNGRDLAQWVRTDVLLQAYFDACLVLGTPRARGGLGCPLNGAWGGPFLDTLLCEAATRALTAVWFQKWFVHRRLRPEEFGGRVQVHKNGLFQYPIHSDVLTSKAIKLLNLRNGSWLLPLAFPEGSPTHPSYGAGNATVAGACVTLLKALFDEESLIAHPVVPNASGTHLLPFNGPPLSVGGELNKLASNVATGRNIAGVHWRSDTRESLLLGERVALGLLEETLSLGSADMSGGVSFTGFDGTRITVRA